MPEVTPEQYEIAGFPAAEKRKLQMDLNKERRDEVKKLAVAEPVFYNHLVESCSDDLMQLITADDDFIAKNGVPAVLAVEGAPTQPAVAAIKSCLETREESRLYLIIKRICTQGISANNIASAARSAAAAEDSFSALRQEQDETAASYKVRFDNSYKAMMDAGGDPVSEPKLAARYMEKLSYSKFGELYTNMKNHDNAGETNGTSLT